MIDYLSNLVARHLGKIEPVQPRLASRFEPPSSAARLHIEQEMREGAQTPDARETGGHFDIVETQTSADPLPNTQPRTPQTPQRKIMPLSAEPDDLPTTRPQSSTRDPRTAPRADMTGEHTSAETSSVIEPIHVQVVSQSTAVKDSTPPGHSLETAPSSTSIRQSPDPAATGTSSDRVSDALSHARSGREREIQADQGSFVSTRLAPQSFSTQTAEPPPVLLLEQSSPGASIKTSAEAQQASSLTLRPSIKPSVEGQQSSSLMPHPPPVSSRHLDAPPQSNDAPKASRPDSPEETAAAHPSRAHEPAGVLAQPHTARSTETTATAQAASKENVEAAPVINVTIGRVEIRAVQAPAAPRRPGVAAPPMNLDDYLRRRAGGGGR